MISGLGVGVLRELDGVTLTAVLAVAAATLAACDEANPSRVCVDGQSRRIADPNCGQASTTGRTGYVGAHWYYMPAGGVAPAVGGLASGGSETPTAGKSYSAAPEEGGVSRGGFGGGGEGEGGHGGGEGGHGGGGE